MIIQGSKNSVGTKPEPTKMPDLPPFITDDIGFINCDDEDDCNEKITKTTGKQYIKAFLEFDNYFVTNVL